MFERIKNVVIIAVVLIMGVASVEAKKKPSRKSMTISSNLQSISNHTDIDLYFTYKSGPNTTVEVLGPEPLVDSVIILCTNGQLTITSDVEFENLVNSGSKIIVRGEDVNTFNVYSNADVNVDKVDGTLVTFNSYSNGDIRVDYVDCASLRAMQLGNGNIDINKVDCASLDLLGNGTGVIRVSNADCGTLLVNLNGSGDIIVDKIDGRRIRAVNAGTGNIKLSGSVKSATYTTLGPGGINASGVESEVTTTNYYK